jgi:hypothetical protein
MRNNGFMLNAFALAPAQIDKLNALELSALVHQLIERVSKQDLHITNLDQTVADQSNQIKARDLEIKARDLEIERITFELKLLRRQRFAAKSEAMSPMQRDLFEETFAADEADLQAQLAALKALAPSTKKPNQPKAASCRTPPRT